MTVVGASFASLWFQGGRISDRSVRDVLRSFARWISGIVPGYEVRFADSEDFATPFAVVRLVGPAQHDAGSAALYTTMQAVTAHLYLPEAASVEEGELAALEVEEEAEQWFRGNGRGAPPLRIPLYAYDGVPLEGVGSNAHYAHDYVRVDSLTIDRNHDPIDPRQWAVVISARLSWERSSEVRIGESVQSLRMTESAVIGGSS